MLGVGSKICENGILLVMFVILIKVCRIRFKKYEIITANGLKIIINIINTIPIIKAIENNGETNILDIINVKEIVLKWYSIIGSIIKFADIETKIILLI